MVFTTENLSSAPQTEVLDTPALTDSIIFGIPIYGDGLLQGDAGFESSLADDDSRNRLAASVFANAHDGIVIANAERVILDTNRAYTRITGFQAHELIGRRLLAGAGDAHPPAFFESLWRDLDSSGFWRGEISTTHRAGHTRTDLVSLSAVRDARGILTHYVAIFSDITALKEIQKKFEHLAYHDALTGLPNRPLLYDRIQQALSRIERQGELAAICFIDLDNFKPVNDNLGHQVGDQLLVEVAQRLSDSLRGGDSVARLGGDEFALLLCDIDTPSEVRDILSRLLNRISQPYHIQNHEITLSASIGYTLAPGDSGDPDTLLRHADQAMYLSKQGGRSRFTLFDTALDRQARTRNESLAQLQRALERGEFRLYYQPKLDIRRGEVVGLEGLIRWAHPERGILGPADFLLPLGSHPILNDIGEWAIREALTQIETWRQSGVRMPISINIAACQLLHPEFLPRLANYLKLYPDIGPGQLELEVLETTALEDIGHVANVISGCQELGVDFALDDFGTGYSSLLYLKRLPAKTLKIDQSFTRDMLQTSEGTDAIAGIMGLANAFRRSVVAEGVETVEQGIVLLRLGCDVVQGYAIARPMPAEAVPAWLSNYRPDPAWKESIDTPWRRSDFPLLAAEIEQRRWLAIAKHAVEKKDAQFMVRQFRDIEKTAFGLWLERIGKTRYLELAEMAPIFGLLDRVQTLRQQLIEDISQQGGREAQDLLAAHLQQSKALILSLRSLLRAIGKTLPDNILVTETGKF